ncbi:MAG: nucleotidyltransferase family protein [Acidimicrobiales bacterium]
MPAAGLEAEVRTALLAVAGHGLPGTGDAAHREPLEDRHWRSLLAAARRERMSGLLDRAVADGLLAATPAQAEDAEAAAAHFLRGTLRLERSLLEVAGCLGRAGIAFVVLKGPAVARLDEADPALRHYVDLDLLVRDHALDDALATLASVGYVRDLPERRTGFDRRFAKEVPLAHPMRPELDLHRTLALGSFGLRLHMATLWASTTPFQLGGTTLDALDAEGRFVHACMNAMLGDDRPRLVALRDVVRISTAHRLRPERLGAIVPPGGGAAVVAAAVAACTLLSGARVGEAAASFAEATVPSQWERLALRAYRAQGGSNTLELLSGALGVRGTDRARYLRALLAPDAAYVEARKRAGRPPEWGTGLREVARRHRTRREARHE